MIAAPIFTARSASLAPMTFPTQMARPSELTMPRVEPSQTGMKAHLVARVTVLNIVLSPSSAMKKTVATIRKGGDPALMAAIISIEAVPAKSPKAEPYKGNPRQVLNPVGRKQVPRKVSQCGREHVDKQSGNEDAGQNHAGIVAGCQGECDQLGLVSQFSQEDHE